MLEDFFEEFTAIDSTGRIVLWNGCLDGGRIWRDENGVLNEETFHQCGHIKCERWTEE